jgi:hypothetical protein
MGARNRACKMRIMNIPSFPTKIEIFDRGYLIRTRLSQMRIVWPEQAISLAAYMCWPNDAAVRSESSVVLRRWAEEWDAVPPRLHRIQHEWLRVADVHHLDYDIAGGQHQQQRGGRSIGKAVTLAEANARSRGTGAASFWKHWSTYKDVAHLVTAAALICADARDRVRKLPFGAFPFSAERILPFHIAMFMPDFVIAIALGFECWGLTINPDARTETPLDAETVWRIPPDINVMSAAPVVRKIRLQDILVLNSRRAGNRGRRI